MKTITEYNGFQINNALKKMEELAAAEKTAEEMPALIGEACKLEGDKLKHFMNAIEVAKAKPAHLKRVVVLALAEGEKPPTNAKQKDESFYLAEYYPSPQKKEAREKGDRGPRKGKSRGNGKDKKGRGGFKNS